MRVLSVLTAAILLFMAACVKQTGPTMKSKSDILSEGAWRLVEAYSNTEKDGVYKSENLYEAMPDCERDNLTIFGKDHKVTIDEGSSKCHPSNPQQQSSQKWALVSNTSLELIDIKSANNRYEAAIIELSESTLHVRVTGTRDDGTKFTDTYKYERVQ